jgi:TPR repeat protein
LRFYVLIILLFSISISAQDTTRSEAFKDNQPHKYPLVKAKYPSYSLIAGYVLVSDANRGDPFAEHELGIRYLIGNGFPSDTVKAIYWIRKAADQNLPSARFNYGIMLYNGIGVPWNPFEAYQNFLSSAKSGLKDAQFAVGLLFTDNLVLNRDLNKAYRFFKQSADAGYTPAKDALRQLMKNGFTPSPEDSAYKTDNLEKFVKKSDTIEPLMNPNWDLDLYDFDAKAKKEKTDKFVNDVLNKKPVELKKYLGLDELTPSLMPKDTTSVGLLKFAAENGSPEALLVIARAYETGTLFKKNLMLATFNYLRAFRLGSIKAGQKLFTLVQSKELFDLLKEKISSGDPDAMYAWAGISALGFENQISDQQALEFLKKAVNKNHIPSMIEMGMLYSVGKLVPRNREKAIEYWSMAKELGSKEAEVRIAVSNLTDSTYSKNTTGDFMILKNNAEQGSIFAETALGYCYEKGAGTKEDKAMAIHFYRQAAQRGNETAYNSLKRMYDEVRPNEDEFKIYESD